MQAAKKIRVTAGVAALAACVTLAGGPAFARAAGHDDVPVSWHAQTGGTDVVEGARAHLVRTDNGISFRLHARDLEPGNAYTLWLVVIDAPESCASSPCTGPDILTNDGPDAQVTFAAGRIAGEDGTATFAGHRSAGAIEGWLPNRSFDNPRGAEVHLVVNDHGPAIPEHMPGMIHTYRGGCSDDSPFPGVFPQTALDDGEPGPNTCLLTQVAIFQA